MESIHIRCKRCRNVFAPDQRDRGHWICPECGTRNPNLLRCYRSVAHVCILALLWSALMLAMAVGERFPLSPFCLPHILHFVLCLIIVVRIYRTRAPWSISRIHVFMLLSFGSAFVFGLLQLLPAVCWPDQSSEETTRVMTVLAQYLAVYAGIFGYLLWLRSARRKCVL